MSGGIFLLGGGRLKRRAVQRVRVAQRRRLGGLDRVREDACQSLRRSGRAAAGHCHRRGTQAERGTKPLLLERGSASTLSNALIRGISALVTSLCRLSSIANPSHLKNNWIRQCRQWFSIPLRSKCSTVRSSPGAHFDADQNTESKPSRGNG